SPRADSGAFARRRLLCHGSLRSGRFRAHAGRAARTGLAIAGVVALALGGSLVTLAHVVLLELSQSFSGASNARPVRLAPRSAATPQPESLQNPQRNRSGGTRGQRHAMAQIGR